MLSSLPKLADRAFILGQFLPTLLFAVAVLFLFRDQEPPDLWTDIMTGESLGKAAYLLLVVWIVAVVTLILKQPLYQFFEGYMFPSWLAKILTSRNQKHLRCRLREIR